MELVNELYGSVEDDAAKLKCCTRPKNQSVEQQITKPQLRSLQITLKNTENANHIMKHLINYNISLERLVKGELQLTGA